ncbi:MAG TPA: SDR family oxidoreductase [Rhizomicrobium sp.]|jgi:enoyl-[acyl-carrier protein] reductase I|nr:SDR family oxidoreductase [Rhizomicrobium sp.]
MTDKKLMQGRRGLVMGVANDHSIAWGIARTLASHGAEIAFTYQGDAQARRLKPLAESIGAKILLPGDVEKDEELDSIFATLQKEWGGLDFVIHAIAHSDKNELKGRYVDTSRANFVRSLSISCYSFTAIAQRARPLMTKGGSLLTLTYLGSQRVTPNYNVMGVAKAGLEASVRYLAADLGQENIRVNAISAGPMRTLAGSVIGESRTMFRWNKAQSPLGRTVELDHVGNAALYLVSGMSEGVTGEIHYVDAGYNIIGAPSSTKLKQWMEEGESNAGTDA